MTWVCDGRFPLGARTTQSPFGGRRQVIGGLFCDVGQDVSRIKEALFVLYVCNPKNRQLPGNASWTLSMLFEFAYPSLVKKRPKLILRRLD